MLPELLISTPAADGADRVAHDQGRAALYHARALDCLHELDGPAKTETTVPRRDLLLHMAAGYLAEATRALETAVREARTPEEVTALHVHLVRLRQVVTDVDRRLDALVLRPSAHSQAHPARRGRRRRAA